MRRPAITLPTLIVLACMTLPSAAQTITVRVPSQSVTGHLAGDLVVWGEAGNGRLRVRAADTAGARSELGSVDLLPGRSVADLAVGGGGVFIARTSYDAAPGQNRTDRYTLAPLGGPPLIDCAPPTNGFDPRLAYDRRIAGDGTTIVSPGAGCRGDAIIARAPGVPDRYVLEPGSVVDQRVDGDWLAAIVDIERAAFVVVHDLRTQREAYRIALSSPSFNAGSAPQYVFDIDRDGTVVVGEPRLLAIARGSFVTGPGCRLWWASPAAPQPHDLALKGCASVALHGGVLALALRDGPQAALVATNLAGTPQIAVRRAPQINAIELGGGRVAWTERSCREANYLRTAPLRAERDRHSPGCVIRVRSRGPLRMDSRGRVRLQVDCPSGCVGHLYALRCNHRGCIPRPVAVRLAHAKRRTVTLRLTAQARRLVRRHPVKVLLKTYTGLGPGRDVMRTIIARR